MKKYQRIKINNVNYRKGYIEVYAGIHDTFINIESWDINPDIDLSKIDISDKDFPISGIAGNTELELNIQEAEELIRQLQSAISIVKEETN